MKLRLHFLDRPKSGGLPVGSDFGRLQMQKIYKNKCFFWFFEARRGCGWDAGGMREHSEIDGPIFARGGFRRGFDAKCFGVISKIMLPA